MALTLNGSTGLSGIVGSAGTPALQGTDTNTGYFFGTDILGSSTGGQERLRIDSGGRLLIGQTSGFALYANGLLQVSATSGTAAISVTRWSDNGSSPYINLGKSRGGIGTYTIVQDDDRLGQINFCGADGNDLASPAAGIAGYVDGTPGSNEMPGRLVFFTASDNVTVSETERLIIDSTGKVSFLGTGAGSGSRGLEIATESVGAADEGVIFNARASGVTGRLKFQTNSATAMTILGNGGNVGIGRTDPGHKLAILGGASSQLEIKGTEADFWLTSTGSGSDKAWRILGSTGGSTHRFRIYDNANGKEPFYIIGSSGTNTQHVHINSGDLVFDAAGTGINFAAVTPSGGSVDSNILADYEVGEFTPTWYTQTSLITVDYHTQKGYYVKIGRMVYFQVYIRINSRTGGSGNLVVKDLPFTPQDATTHPNVAYGGLNVAYTNSWLGDTVDRGLVSSSSAIAYVYVGQSSGTNVNAGAGNLGNGTQFRAYGSYVAA